MTSVASVKGIGRLSNAELVALSHAASRVPTSVDALSACIGFETAFSFSASEPNRAGSGAMGLIQFMPRTMCALLGLEPTDGNMAQAVARFRDMGFIEQLEYVVKYFAWFRPHDLTTVEALYCAIFWPAAIDKPDEYVIAAEGSAVFRQNAGFDVAGNRDGKITRAEICDAVRRVLDDAGERPRVPIPDLSDPALMTDEDRVAILELVRRTSDDETEAFRGGTPFPAEA